MESDRDLAERFAENFNRRLLAIKDVTSEDNWRTRPDVLGVVSSDLAQMRKSLAEAISAGILPSYDQRKFNDELREADHILATTQATSQGTKGRFAFKRKVAHAPAVSAVIPETRPVSEVKHIDHDSVEDSQTETTVIDRVNEHITREIWASGQPKTLSLKNLDCCFVDLRPLASDESNSTATIPAIHAQNVRNSILLMHKLSGSILLYDLHNCLLAVECQQFRMHSSSSVDVILAISSNPVIEHCSTIRFGILHGCENAHTIPYQPQDFSHIKNTPSQNWTTIGSSLSLDEIQKLLIHESASTLQCTIQNSNLLPLSKPET